MRDWTENQIELILIRHGETLSNQKRCYLGKTDEALSAEGADALRRLQREREYPALACLFVSPMRRCLETARILYPFYKTIVIPEWEEMDFGAFEGKNYRQLREDARYQAWIDSGGRLPFPGGESREAFIDRCLRGLDRLAGHLAASDVLGEKGNEAMPNRVGAIVHGGTIMALLSAYLGGDYYDYQVKNGDGYRCLFVLRDGAHLDHAVSDSEQKPGGAGRILTGETL